MTYASVATVMSESGGGGGDTSSTATTTLTTSAPLKVTTAATLSAGTPSPRARSTTPVAAAAGAASPAGGDVKDEREALQKEWMEDFIAGSKKLTIADFMNMFMHIRMRQEHMRSDEAFAATVAVHPAHYIRNRYRDILPYDKNRVLIRAVDAEENAEGYVNASHVSLPHGLTTFIAAQAPLPQTLDDFWQMVDEQGVQLIVMLCKLVEMSKVKCERYWPETVGTTEVYGAYEITLEKEERFDDDEYLLRTLRMRSLQQGAAAGKTRIVHQLHYKEWPDHGCPTGSSQLLNMVDRMAQLAGATTAPEEKEADNATPATAAAATSNGNGSPVTNKDRPPVLVHCSAGVGRTGTIILINHIRELILQKMCVDINLLSLVVALREQRSSMVQTQDQFQFVHRCVLTYCRRALGLPEIEDGPGDMPAPPPYVTSVAGGSGCKLPPGLGAGNVTKSSVASEDEDDEDTDFEDATAVPDYPDEPARAPRGPEDLNSSSC